MLYEDYIAAAVWLCFAAVFIYLMRSMMLKAKKVKDRGKNKYLYK